MRNPEIWIGLIILGFLLFGAKKMPDAARGLGRSMRIFKSEIKGMQDDETAHQAQQQGQIPAGYQPQPGQPVYQQQPAYQPQPGQPVFQQQPAYQPQPGQPVYQQQPVYQPPVPAPAPVDPAQAEHREAQ
jgi:sec-independent protein translocase protein TatA